MAEGILQTLDEELLRWPGVDSATGRFSSTVYTFEGEELGHVHPDGTADLSFPPEVREELLRDGRAGPHRIFPESDTDVSYRVSEESELSEALALFARSYELKKGANVRG